MTRPGKHGFRTSQLAGHSSSVGWELWASGCVSSALISMAEKRKRSANYSDVERERLTDLMDSYKDVIEDKRHDVRNIKRKTEAWDKLTDTLNTDARVTKRTSKQLKHLWADMKGNAKKEGSRYKRQLFYTGGGSPPEPIDDISKKIMDMLPQQFESIPGVEDDDTLLPGEYCRTFNQVPGAAAFLTLSSP